MFNLIQILVVIIISVTLTQFIYSETITVGQSGGTSFTLIQEAIDAANDGDEIVVSPGTYFENIYFLGKNIILTSTDPTSRTVVESTVIDANSSGSVVTFAGTEGTTCALQGFKITNGRGTLFGIGTQEFGGGILGNNTLATIKSNIITENKLLAPAFDSIGAGIAFCDGLIEGNEVSYNEARVNSPGIGACNGTIRKNLIKGNVVDQQGRGGGIFDSEGLIEYNIITENRAGSGGGLHECGGTIQNNVITSNSAEAFATIPVFQYSGRGGGLRLCVGLIQNNLIYNNTANGSAGAMSSCVGPIKNNTIVFNYATNPFNDAANGGITNGGEILNCILWGNRADATGSLQLFDDDPPPKFSLIEDWTGAGEAIITSEPLFIDLEKEDFRLKADSPAIDAGGSVSLTIDFCGTTRPFDASLEIRGDGTNFDIGAFEFTIDQRMIRDILLGTINEDQLTTDQLSLLDFNQDSTTDTADIIRFLNENHNCSLESLNQIYKEKEQ